ncbi:RecQ family ATP-dependent DNA helicase [Salisediminibacterium selenitireducens]|uniref:ATP-dependent DNA helicase, RecQ family n=1 Tax=Bacillus selenitireducens (strain ATCC 700615 / DSM 15326 / MLS10) TaxID=439292 RepID=D6XVD0_BACIE|nr:ATP-dependent DNA helicase RecQ [Salisediminibacterium selenitireducens]ADH99668.1 ATP-dependent DNA helicase, RecQ family [[Bacillus] selenitireducens MLS10]
MNLEQALQDWFGYSSFRYDQKEIIESVLNGHDTLAVMPTGSGKSICYLLPSKLTEGLTVVVSPLVSLMEDQVMQLRAEGYKHVAHLSSMLQYEEKKELLKGISRLDVLYLSPEMLQKPEVKSVLGSYKIAMFVIDEAHCISQWGHEFRTDYLKLGTVIRSLGHPVTLALTATATEDVREDIVRQLGMNDPVSFVSTMNRNNIFMEMTFCETEGEKQKALKKAVQEGEGPVIVYCGTRSDTEAYSEFMRYHGTDAHPYHGGMSKEDRLLIQQQFFYDQIQAVCATNAFGMGINKTNIARIIHLHVPSSVEQYIQEIGRAGRDGRQSEVKLFWTDQDVKLPVWMVESEFPEEARMDQLSAFFTESDHQSVDPAVSFIPENQRKMVTHYLKAYGVIDEQNRILPPRKRINDILMDIKKHFQLRQIEKMKQVREMHQLIGEADCIRNGLMNYFSEQPHEKPRYCCSRCQEDRPVIRSEQTVEPNYRNIQINWQDRLYWKLTGEAKFHE